MPSLPLCAPSPQVFGSLSLFNKGGGGRLCPPHCYSFCIFRPSFGPENVSLLFVPFYILFKIRIGQFLNCFLKELKARFSILRFSDFFKENLVKINNLARREWIEPAENPLIVAVQCNKLELVDFFIYLGVNVNSIQHSSLQTKVSTGHF